MADHPVSVGKVQEAESERYGKLRSKFHERFGHDPVFYARAPGRVNLIGEHIDYCGYAVLPMAIEQDIVLAASPNIDNEIVLINMDPQYTEFTCSVENFTITKGDPQWYNYALCGVRGVMEKVGANVVKGFNAVVEGRIPRSAGLSSSSALVCAAAITMAHTNGWKLSKKTLSELCAHCERYIGTEGGGMDQAISFMANHGMAKLIEFNPLRSVDVHLPQGAAFVVSNSLVEHNKAGVSDFNIRVTECRLAAQVLAKTQGLPWREIRRLVDVQDKLEVSLEKMVILVADKLHEEPYTKEEVCQVLEVTEEELAATSLNPSTQELTSFKLFQRATHVYSEANRVMQFKMVCEERRPDALEQLGRLMDASHASCRDMYECSHPDLDKLVKLCRDAGARGSRMTGAGWGGCCVSIVEASRVMTLLTKVRDGYYSPDPARAPHTKEALFGTQPGGGAAIYVD
ncbi:hypothetical protein BaRGS_00016195 [Batillaria attramentaria]|uniref:Galactokinase n=1 Tax=Batillaria attramentaria TaxID=370345 RepID=A0ABD0KZD3_9CAEN